MYIRTRIFLNVIRLTSTGFNINATRLRAATISSRYSSVDNIVHVITMCNYL